MVGNTELMTGPVLTSERPVIRPQSAARAMEFRQAEVHQLHPRFGEHDVAGLDIPVDDPLPVRLIQSIRQLDSIFQNILRGQ